MKYYVSKFVGFAVAVDMQPNRNLFSAEAEEAPESPGGIDPVRA
jgi:hypothetical protein